MSKLEVSKLTNYGRSYHFTVPVELYKDKEFPFELGDHVVIEIIEDALHIRRLK